MLVGCVYNVESKQYGDYQKERGGEWRKVGEGIGGINSNGRRPCNKEGVANKLSFPGDGRGGKQRVMEAIVNNLVKCRQALPR